jgi:hypothetical protein
MAELGHPISVAQLNRWSRRRLIPKPRRRGLGRGEGVKSEYPVLTFLHAILLDSLLRESYTLDEAGWMMWCGGLPVTDGARQILQRAFEKAKKRLDATVAVPAEEQADHGDDEPTGGSQRARTADETSVAVQVVHDILLGVFEDEQHEQDDLQIIGRAFDAEHLPANELGEVFTNVSRTVGLTAIERVIKNASNDDLESWRNEIQTVSAHLSGGGPSSTAQLPLWTYVQWVGLRVAEHPIAAALLKALEALGYPEGWDPPLIQIVRRHPDCTPDLGI